MPAPILDEAPPGVTLRDFDDFPAARKAIFDGVHGAFKKVFPQSYGGVRMELHDLGYEDPEEFSIADQKKALLTDKFLSRRLRGTLHLYDDTTNELLDKKPMTLAQVPWLTDRGTFIHGGNEYTSMMQSRLQPGAYTRRQSNGGLETQFNVRSGTGTAFRVSMEPETSQYKLRVQQANLHLYSLLHDIGIPDSHLEKSWGPEVLKSNQKKYDARVFEKAYARFVPPREQKPDAEKADKVKQLVTAIESAKVHAGVLKRTLPNFFDMTKSAGWMSEYARQVIEEQMEKHAFSDIRWAPDFTPEQLGDRKNDLEGHVGPNLGSMRDTPKHWIPEGDSSWLQWYEQYHHGRRTDDDAKQMMRWKRQKRLQGDKFVRRPTPRRAFALRSWAIDAVKLLPEADREAFQQKMDDYKSAQYDAHELEKSAAAVESPVIVDHPPGLWFMEKMARMGAGVLFKLPNGKYLLEENTDDGTMPADMIGKLRPAGGGRSKRDRNLRDTILREMKEEFALDPGESKEKIDLLGYIPAGKFKGCALFEMVAHGLKPGVYQASNSKTETVKLVEADLDDPRYVGTPIKDLVMHAKEPKKKFSLDRLRNRREPDYFQEQLDASELPGDITFYVSHSQDRCFVNTGDWHSTREADSAKAFAERFFKTVECESEAGRPSWADEKIHKNASWTEGDHMNKVAHDLVHYSREKHPELRPLSYEELEKDRTSGRWANEPEKAKAYVDDRRRFEKELHKRLASRGIQTDPNNSFLYATIDGHEQFGNPATYKHLAPLNADVVNSSFFDVVGAGKGRTTFGHRGLESALRRWEAANAAGKLETSEYMGMPIKPRIEVITPNKITPTTIDKTAAQALFRQRHGTAYDPNSRTDRMKMHQLQLGAHPAGVPKPPAPHFETQSTPAIGPQPPPQAAPAPTFETQSMTAIGQQPSAAPAMPHFETQSTTAIGQQPPAPASATPQFETQSTPLIGPPDIDPGPGPVQGISTLPNSGAMFAKAAAVAGRSHLPFRVAAEALLSDGDHVIGQMTDGASGKKFIKFPGGGIDDGEDLKTGLLRELMEEAGATPHDDIMDHGRSQTIWPPEMGVAKPEKYNKWQGSQRHVFSGRLKSQGTPTSQEGDALTGEMRIPMTDAMSYIQDQIDNPADDAGGTMLEHRKLQMAALQALMGPEKSAKLRESRKKVKMVEQVSICCPHCDEEFHEKGGGQLMNREDTEHGAPAIFKHKCGGLYIAPERDDEDNLAGWLRESLEMGRAQWKSYLEEHPEKAGEYVLDKSASDHVAENGHHWKTRYEQCGHTTTCRCSAPKQERVWEGLCPPCVWKAEKEEAAPKEAGHKAVLDQLLKAKGLSDQKRYAEKAHIIAALLRDHGQDFVMDDDDDMAGLTHVPTGFEIHAPRGLVPAAVATSPLHRQHGFGANPGEGLDPAGELQLEKDAQKWAPWIGVDLDGTLAWTPQWKGGVFFIGKPVAAMKKRVMGWINGGKTVKIFTARAADPENIEAIETWLETHGFPKLEVTNVKDPGMIALYDDKAYHVPRNTGNPTHSHE